MATAGLAAVCVRREAVLVLTPKFQPMIRVTRAVVVYGCTRGLNCATCAIEENAGHAFLRATPLPESLQHIYIYLHPSRTPTAGMRSPTDRTEGAQGAAVQATGAMLGTPVRAPVDAAAAQHVASVAAACEETLTVEAQAPPEEEAAASPHTEEAPRAVKPRPRGPTPSWGKTEPSWNGRAWVDDLGRERPSDQRKREKNARRRTPEEQAANAAAERKRKARKKEEARVKEEEEQKLKEEEMVRGAPAPACAAEAPAAAVVVRNEEDMLTRKKGYDTTNNLNKLLTQGFSCSIPDRNKKALFSTLISKINALEVHDLMRKYQAVKVGEVAVVGVLRLVRRELESKEPHVSPTPTTRAPRALEVEVWVLGI